MTPLTPEKKVTAFWLMSFVLSAGHEIVTAAIEGRTLDHCDVEEYYTAWTMLIDEIECRGILIPEVISMLKEWD